jgi:hypothetical protein
MATWLDTIKTGYTIKTGEGSGYFPNWMVASAKKSVRYNVSKFEFKGLYGSLVKRGTSQGQEYRIEIIFHGGDNVGIAKAFKKSADNPGAWTITHPLYGAIYAQPVDEWEYDNSQLNQTVISGTVIETLLDSGVAATVNQPDLIESLTTVANQLWANKYVSDAVPPKITDIQGMLNHVNGVYNSIQGKIANVQANVTNYRNIYNQAVNTITNPITATAFYVTNAITSVQGVITAPAYFADTVVNRLAMFDAAFAVINKDLAPILAAYDVSTSTRKRLYENNGGAIIMGMCNAAMNNITTDYDYRPDVLNVIAHIIAVYNAYIDNIISLQTDTGADPDAYIPDADSVIAAQTAVFATTQALFDISANAKQQRTYVLPHDDNIINVAYKLYGGDPDDTIKTAMIANNNIGLDEILILKKDRKIIYYV